jgi:translation initiation factor IF-2
MEGMLEPKIEEKITGNAEIQQVFKISKVGKVAGCMCVEGKIKTGSKVRLIRDGIVVYTGELEALKRFKDDVKEVSAGQDCGMSIKDFSDYKTGDFIEAYEEFEIQRKL